MKRLIFGFVLLFITFQFGFSQTAMVSDRVNKIAERLSIKYDTHTDNHSALKPYSIEDVVKIATNILDYNQDILQKDLADIEFLLADNVDWIRYIYGVDKYQEIMSKIESSRSGWFKNIYRNPSSFYAGHHQDFFIKVDPVINFQLGKDSNKNHTHFVNTRGFRISGLLDKKIYFYSSLYESQRSFLDHINRKINRDLAVPGQAFYKKYKSSVFSGIDGYDFLNAQGYLGFKITKNLSAQLGHGKFFIGDGMRSLFLSDYSTNYYYLKFDTRVWKFHYQNIFAELAGTSREQIGIDNILPKKFIATHYLSFAPTENIELGLFETVVFNRSNQFELQYLNPIIIYRTVEQFIGSGDNVLVGLNWKWNFKKRFSIYGQLLLDEFNFSKIKEDRTWWGNKYGFQFGIKYLDVLNIDHLDLQVETNIVRPYTYAHRDSLLSYSHYNQALAHPLGANFKEVVLLAKYRPFNNLNIHAKVLFAIKGEDLLGYNFGGNILISNDNRPMDTNGNIREFGFKIGDGAERNITQYSFNSSYMFYHNYFLDFNIIYRKELYSLYRYHSEDLYVGGGLRINIASSALDY